MLKKILLSLLGVLGLLSLIRGISLKFQKVSAVSIGIIGGSDGPTSVFLAGKLNPIIFFENTLIIIGVGILLILLIYLFIKYKKESHK